MLYRYTGLRACGVFIYLLYTGGTTKIYLPRHALLALDSETRVLTSTHEGLRVENPEIFEFYMQILDYCRGGGALLAYSLCLL